MIRLVVKIDQALSLEPEDVEVWPAPGRRILVAVAPPTALGLILFAPGGLALMVIGRFVTLDEARLVLLTRRRA